jgi:asparagine synthase (glutamine-hydrolysing)
MLTGVVASERHLRKVREFVQAIDSQVIFPFGCESVVNYIRKFPEEYIVDRKKSRNKTMLRELLKKELNLNSDLIGKLGFTYNFEEAINLNSKFMIETINNCTLWRSETGTRLFNRPLKSNYSYKALYRNLPKLLLRVFVISLWFNTRDKSFIIPPYHND